MPKRRNLEEDLASLTRKIKKFKRRLQRQDGESLSPESTATPVPILDSDDWLTGHSNSAPAQNDNTVGQDTPQIIASAPPDDQSEVVIVESQAPAITPPPEPQELFELDDDILEILGADPSDTTKYGPALRAELAARLQHTATEGLDKEDRKNLITKYLLPDNCTLIGAPSLNPEIRAAIPLSIATRDRGIEAKQKQLASAISCLANVIADQIKSTEKDKESLKKLMDAIRLLCDLQRGDSNTRRNFILFALKKEMKEHLTKTKIDSFLFGEQLSETLKSARAVTKSGTELKQDSGSKGSQGKSFKPGTSRPLNRRAPPARRPPGPVASTSTNYEPAQWTRPPPPPPPPTPAHTSRPSYRRPAPRRLLGTHRGDVNRYS